MLDCWQPLNEAKRPSARVNIPVEKNILGKKSRKSAGLLCAGGLDTKCAKKCLCVFSGNELLQPLP